MKRGLAGFSFFVVAAAALAFTACTPPYPQCKEDKHCKERPENKTDKLVWCVKGNCVECRDKTDCAECQECGDNGACSDVAGCCSANKPCTGKCETCRNNRCGPNCSADFPCKAGERCDNGCCVPDWECEDPRKPCTDPKMKCVDHKCVPKVCPEIPCPDGQECQDGKCVPKAPPPKKCPEVPCPPGQICKDGECVAKPDCIPPEGFKVYFDFDKSNIRTDQKDTVDKSAACIKEMADKKIILEGNCDERGTREYNVALGERRWKSVRDALKAAGIPEDRMEGVSFGKEKPVCTERNETCWQKNRRVDIKGK
jgi:peptidoglycan-associated lipoprotein